MKAQKEGRPLSHRPWIVGLWLGDEPEILGKETPLLRHWYTKCIILSRQARDKHRESSTQKTEWRFLRSGLPEHVRADLVSQEGTDQVREGRRLHYVRTSPRKIYNMPSESSNLPLAWAHLDLFTMTHMFLGAGTTMAQSRGSSARGCAPVWISSQSTTMQTTQPLRSAVLRQRTHL